ncbi:GNAT family N-acetyltransferase [Deinococcus lacus]|uniref:GNAT family N-acetyltransferase n=1 Tax=Deinococcus lacus TaxID=392561 RepID=A0ABW1YC72_9DEIO
MERPLAVLTGEKVILARLRRTDIPEMARHFANLELTAYLGALGGAYSLEDEQAYFESVSKNRPDAVTFGIYHRESGELLGEPTYAALTTAAAPPSWGSASTTRPTGAAAMARKPCG